MRLIYKPYKQYHEDMIYGDNCVSELDYIEGYINNKLKRIEINKEYDGGKIINIYTHPESSCYWCVVLFGNQLFDIEIDRPITYGIFKDSTELSGGHLW